MTRAPTAFSSWFVRTFLGDMREEMDGLRSEAARLSSVVHNVDAKIAQLEIRQSEAEDTLRSVVDELRSLKGRVGHQAGALDLLTGTVQKLEEAGQQTAEDREKMWLRLKLLMKQIDLDNQGAQKATMALFERLERLRAPHGATIDGPAEGAASD